MERLGWVPNFRRFGVSFTRIRRPEFDVFFIPLTCLGPDPRDQETVPTCSLEPLVASPQPQCWFNGPKVKCEPVKKYLSNQGGEQLRSSKWYLVLDSPGADVGLADLGDGSWFERTGRKWFPAFLRETAVVGRSPYAWLGRSSKDVFFT